MPQTYCRRASVGFIWGNIPPPHTHTHTHTHTHSHTHTNTQGEMKKSEVAKEARFISFCGVESTSIKHEHTLLLALGAGSTLTYGNLVNRGWEKNNGSRGGDGRRRRRHTIDEDER